MPVNIKKGAVYYCKDRAVKVVACKDLDDLKRKLLKGKYKSVRLCAHKNVRDKLHEMVIIHSRNSYVQPHNHPGKSVSYTVIEGGADLVFFDNKGKIIKIISMGTPQSSKIFYFRIEKPYYYMPIARTKHFIFLETIEGPFKKNHTVYAPWAPAMEDNVEVKEFLKKINKYLKKK